MTIFLFTQSAFASNYDANDTWKELSHGKTFEKISYTLPQFTLSNNVWANAGSVCIDGDIMKSTMEHYKCVKWGKKFNRSRTDRSNEYQDDCLQKKRVFPAVKMSGTKLQCVDWGYAKDIDPVDGKEKRMWKCVKYDDVAYQLKSSYQVKVYKFKKGAMPNNEGRLLFTKTYYIKSCGN